jgi:murein DD-endopeptidase MepM/ murein hydrolase activator NlpD
VFKLLLNYSEIAAVDSEKNNAWRRLLSRLRFKYRLVVMDDESYEERYSLKLSQLNLFTAVGIIAIALILVTTWVIAFTPLKEYIPGYSNDVATKKKLVVLASKVDSLERDAAGKKQLIENIRSVITGNVNTKKPAPKPEDKDADSQVNISASEQEMKFRKDLEQQDRYNINAKAKKSGVREINNYYFFTPLKGRLTTAFNIANKHYGVDIVSGKNESVKATLDGTVIFSGWTTDAGHVIHIQHANNLVSVYEHNAVLLKKEGETVKAGDPIAITGNSGELSTNPHLHFELWYDGSPIDPRDLMVF